MKFFFGKHKIGLETVNPPKEFIGITEKEMQEFMKLTGCNGKNSSCPIHATIPYPCCTFAAYTNKVEKM
jgi:hypothetical protein